MGSNGSFEPMDFWKLFEFSLLLFTEERVQGSKLITCLDVKELWTHQLKSIARALHSMQMLNLTFTHFLWSLHCKFVWTLNCPELANIQDQLEISLECIKFYHCSGKSCWKNCLLLSISVGNFYHDQRNFSLVLQYDFNYLSFWISRHALSQSSSSIF